MSRRACVGLAAASAAWLFRLPLTFSFRPPGRALSQQLFGLVASLVIGDARLAAIQIAAHLGITA